MGLICQETEEEKNIFSCDKIFKYMCYMIITIRLAKTKM